MRHDRPVKRVVVTFRGRPDMRAAILDVLGDDAEVVFLADAASRPDALAGADAVITWNINHELDPDELAGLGPVLLQLVSAGAEFVPFDRLSPETTLAANAGGWAEPMAEHVLALTLALAKRLPQNHAAMRRGEFDQETQNRRLRGAVVGILGFGGIGKASARLFEALGARVVPVGRSDDLGGVLPECDVLLVAVPLTRATRGMIGARELASMKPDAILVNVARAAIVDEDALYEHLVRNPSFSAGLDVWWQEHPFESRLPFLDLPNVIGSPHNSAMAEGSLPAAAGHAAENVLRVVRGEPALHVIDPGEYVY